MSVLVAPEFSLRVNQDEPVPKLASEAVGDAGQVGSRERDLPYSVKDELVLFCAYERRHPGRRLGAHDHTPRW